MMDPRPTGAKGAPVGPPILLAPPIERRRARTTADMPSVPPNRPAARFADCAARCHSGVWPLLSVPIVIDRVRACQRDNQTSCFGLNGAHLQVALSWDGRPKNKATAMIFMRPLNECEAKVAAGRRDNKFVFACFRERPREPGGPWTRQFSKRRRVPTERGRIRLA